MKRQALFIVAWGCLALGALAADKTAGVPASAPASAPAVKKKIVFIPGPPSHSYGEHAHGAGCLLMARLLNENVPAVSAEVCKDGWPKDANVLAGADAIVISCDGGRILVDHRKELDALAARGVGLACLHYTLDAGKETGQRMLDWIGGYYEQYWSVNPSWEADFKTLPDHPIARGVKPFKIKDEWYYHMRFRADMAGVTPILTAVPPDITRLGVNGPHSGNAEVRSHLGQAEVVAWAYDRPGGGRGFGFTGLHSHWNLGHDQYRKLLLNAMVWVCGAEVPPDGVKTATPTLEELEANQGRPRPDKWDPGRIQRMIEQFNR